MRYLSPAQILEAVSDVLREVVLPDASSRYARGQIWAAIGLLDNVAVRVNERDELMADEIHLLGEWFAGVGAEKLNRNLPMTEQLQEVRMKSRRILDDDTVSLDDSQRRSLEERLQTLAFAEKALRRPINFVQIFES